MRISRLACLLSTLLLACGGQVGEETIMCTAVERVALTTSDSSPLGFSAQDVLNGIGGSQVMAMEWVDDRSADADLLVDYQAGEIWYEEREWLDDSENLAEIGTDCPDIITIETTAQMTTNDGRLDESWDVILHAPLANEVSFFATLDAIDGELDPTEFAPPGDFDEIRAWVNVVIIDGAVTGDVRGQTSGSDGELAWAQNFEIGIFGLQPE